MRQSVILAVGFFSAATMMAPFFASAEVTTRTCKDGSTSHAATQAEVDASGGPGITTGGGSGIEAGVTQLCPEDAALGISATAGQAKQYLLSIASSERNSKAPPDKAHIDALDNSFAICAAKFLQAYIAKYGPVKVVSAFRCGPNSPSTIQCNRNENAAAGGATNSNHQLGVAVDINPGGGNSSYETLKSFAAANPAYGVGFPWPFYNGAIDKNHMQATTPSRPACAGVSGSPITPGNNPASTLQKTTGVLQSLQNAFFPPQPLQCPAGTMMMNGTCLPQAAQALNQTTSPLSYGQPTQSGTSGGSSVPIGTGIGASGSTGGSGTTIGTSVNISGLLGGSTKNPDKGTSSSAFDLINAIANPTTTPSGAATGTTIGTSVALNDTLENKATLKGTLASQTGVPTSTYTLNPTASQTFVSNDLKNSPAQQFGTSNASTFTILENIKQVLLAVLQLLRPFGGVTPNATAQPLALR